MNSTIKLNFCPSCGKSLQESSKFCAHCGVKLDGFQPAQPISAKAIVIIACSALVLFVATWYSQSALTGKAPTEKFTESAENPEQAPELDQELKDLKEKAEKNPKDKTGWENYVAAITQRLSMKNAPRELVFEAIGGLRHILDADPNDKQALLTMAEISFQQQAFAKSAEFYEKYLALVPEDLDIRARYASSLSFVGKFDDSLKELNKVLSVRPDHFHALAYSAVTYAEMGDRAKAKEIGAKAVKNAPSPEAKQRFEDFLKTLDSSAPSEPAHETKAAAPSLDNPSAQSVVEHVKNNPVAGKKFVDATMVGTDTLKISLNNFPMQQMPPFVKDKFVNGIREKAFASDSTLKKVVLFDSATNQELEVLTK